MILETASGSLIGNGSEPLVGLATLARKAFAGDDLRTIKAGLLERLRRNEDDANALLDLSTVLHLMGQRRLGLSAQALALDLRQMYRLPSATGSTGIRLLGIFSPGDLTENNALEFLVERSDVRLDMLYLRPGDRFPETVPDHDLAMLAICETDRNRPLLERLEPLLKSWPRPVICAPDRIARLSRDGASRLLQSVPGTVMPVTARIDRRTLARAARIDGKAIGFPVIVRPVDSQKGSGLQRIDDLKGIADYLEAHAEPAFYVSRYVDYRGPDGLFRKYRIVLIDGRPYACHMAISDRWVVHYMSAGMLESPSKRAEEAQFFATFDAGFTRRHRHALCSIAGRLGLEYVGIDCGETPEGDLLIFEVDSGMTVHSMDSVEIFSYKQPQMAKVFGAFRQMLVEASARAPCSRVSTFAREPRL